MIIEFENETLRVTYCDTILMYTGYSLQRHYNTKCVEKYVKLKGKLRNTLYKIRGKLYLYQEHFNCTN